MKGTPKDSPAIELFTPEEAAQILKVQHRTIMEWLRQGRLKGIKLGGKLWRIPKQALLDFIEQSG